LFCSAAPESDSESAAAVVVATDRTAARVFLFSDSETRLLLLPLFAAAAFVWSVACN